MEKIVFTIIIFLMFLGLFTSGILSTAANLQINQSANNNITVIQTTVNSIPQPPTCIPVDVRTGNAFFDSVGLISSYINCPLSYMFWLASLSTIKSDIQWLGFLFVGIIAVVVLILGRFILGLIPSISGLGGG